MMKKRIFTAMLVLLLGTAAGCGGQTAASALPENMPDDFAIRYANWIDPAAPNVYDTGAGLVQKDLADPQGQPTAQAALTVTDQTRQAIYDKLRACALDRLTDAPLHAADTGMSPLTEYEITFTAGGQSYTATGDSTAQIRAENDPDAAAFCDFVQYMDTLYRDSPAYQSLPPAVGGYD